MHRNPKKECFMGIIGRSSLVLLAALVAAPAANAAKKCTDTSGFAAVMDAVEAAAPCASATKRGKYVKAAKKAVGKRLSGACKKEFVKRFILQSTCGRKGFVVCCSTKKGGKASSVVKAKKCAKKGGTTCPDTNPTSVGEGCQANGACVTTTTTTTTIPTAAPTTTTMPGPPPSLVLDFVLSRSADSCGRVDDGSGGLVRALLCGGLNIGGGTSTVSEGPTPDGSTSRFGLECAGTTCTVGPTAANPGLNDPGPDCSTTGCNFGTPLPVPNQSQPALSTCVLNTWDRPAEGTLDTSTGTATLSVPLNSDVYLTSNAIQACPRCSASGTPESPGTRTCDRGPRQGQTCVTTSATGLTRDCPTGGSDATRPCTAGGGNCIDGSHVGPIKVDLTPLTTGNVTQTAAADGTFCAGQFGTGCFGSAACRAITETGSPAGPVTPGTPANVTLASVFCIAKTGNGIVDGPG